MIEFGNKSMQLGFVIDNVKLDTAIKDFFENILMFSTGFL